jgi:hypothetical protein
MENRRSFFKSIGALGVLGAIGLPETQALAQTSSDAANGAQDRLYWLQVLEKLAFPVLDHLARRELKKAMPVEAAHPSDRGRYTHLEAFGRLLAGIAPWLQAQGLDAAETKLQRKYIDLALLALDAATDPASPDFLNFSRGDQPLVDTAFLAQALLRAPAILLHSLDAKVKRQLIEALKSSRAIPTPNGRNWVLFAVLVETALLTLEQTTIEERLEGSLRHMLGWYAGDGAYGDGQFFHFDYYNSFVIQPMLVDAFSVLRKTDSRFQPAWAIVLRRAQRFAEVQERLIAPDGTFPSLGRSTTYRFGAFQALAQMALLRQLPDRLNPAQVRCALTAVIRRMIEAPGTFDENGWLQIGFCGHQPSLAEGYISTGSLYLAGAGLLPLGLPPADPFWSGAPARYTSQQLWSGQSLPADHALADVKNVEVPALPSRPTPPGAAGSTNAISPR